MVNRASKFPTPAAPGVPGSGRGWALGAAAYVACWAAWVLFVVVLYETFYSFYRRWRFSEWFLFFTSSVRVRAGCTCAFSCSYLHDSYILALASSCANALFTQNDH